MDDFVEVAEQQDGLARVMMRFYGPYVLLLFDWTGAIIALLAVLFVMGWIRRSGELTSILAAGISHGRVIQPMLVASMALILVQLASRELVLPGLKNALSEKAKIKDDDTLAVLPSYDKTSRILFEGTGLHKRTQVIEKPSCRLYGDYREFGDVISADKAVWQAATADHPAGFLMKGVEQPKRIDQLGSVQLNVPGVQSRPILLTSRDQDWLQPGECFVATTVTTDLLSKDQSATRLSSIQELVTRVKNPAIRSSTSLHVLLHERVVRVPLDFALVLLGLPLVVNRRERNLFVMIGIAILTVLFFFALKTFANVMGGSGYLISPAIAAWTPLLILGPIGYCRLREIQTL